jgi:succinate-semialdehyde dehydrogenase/glutarate-semialdehyde dehydrogenase
MPPDTIERSPLTLRDPSLLRQQCYVDGHWTNADDGGSMPVIDPATGVPVGTARSSMPPRRNAPSTRRAAPGPRGRRKPRRSASAILRKWYELMLANLDDLALILTTEQGKPLAEGEGRGADRRGLRRVVRRGSEADLRRRHPDDRQRPPPRRREGACRRVRAITPWNFPCSMITRKVSPALAAGCTVVIKPAGATPYSAFALAELADRAGFPPGVLNVITGDAPSIGSEMCANPTVRKLSFTGSTKWAGC